MKKLLLVALLILVAVSSFSCKKDVTPTAQSEKKTEESAPSDTPKKEEAPDSESEQHSDIPVHKPETVSEIIAMSDSFSVDTSMKSFSLDGILESVQLSQTPDAGEDYINSTAYLGDSVTLGLGVFGCHPKELVIAVGSINPMDARTKDIYELPDGTKVNFPTALSRLDVKRAVLTFGANAISVMSEEAFLKCYIDLIQEIKKTSPECEIIIQSISPIASTCNFKKFTNVLINRSNLLLLVMAYSQDVRFLNSAPHLMDEAGYLKLEYCSSDDGIHINASGYNIWIDYLKTHALITE